MIRLEISKEEADCLIRNFQNQHIDCLCSLIAEKAKKALRDKPELLTAVCRKCDKTFQTLLDKDKLCPDCQLEPAAESLERIRNQSYVPKCQNTVIFRTEDRDELFARIAELEAEKAERANKLDLVEKDFERALENIAELEAEIKEKDELLFARTWAQLINNHTELRNRDAEQWMLLKAKLTEQAKVIAEQKK